MYLEDWILLSEINENRENNFILKFDICDMVSEPTIF